MRRDADAGTGPIPPFLEPETVVVGNVASLVAGELLWVASPFAWYAMTDEWSEEAFIVQVMHETFSGIGRFRSLWNAHVKALAGVTYPTRPIDFAYDQEVVAMAVYEPFSTTIPGEIPANEVAAMLFAALEAVHDKGEFLGGLSANGVAFLPNPKFVDLSVVPLLTIAPDDVLSQLKVGYPHLAPALLENCEPSVATDIYALASWLTAMFDSSLGKNTVLRAILDQRPEAASWSPRDVVSAMFGSAVSGSPSPIVESAPVEIPAPVELPNSSENSAPVETPAHVSSETPVPTETPGPTEAPVQASAVQNEGVSDSLSMQATDATQEFASPDAPTGSFEAVAPVSVSPSPQTRGGSSYQVEDHVTTADVPFAISQAKLALILIALGLTSLVLSRWFTLALIEPMLPPSKPPKLTPMNADARERFGNRLQRAARNR